MNQFESIEARILFLIYTLYQNNTISLDQKGLLKDNLVSKENGRFMNAITQFEKSKDIDQLQQFLIQFIEMENSISDYISVNSYKTIKSTKPCNLCKETTQSSNTNSNPSIMFSTITVQKGGRCLVYFQERQKYLTQIS